MKPHLKVFILLCFSITTLIAQQGSKLDSLLAAYKNQEEDTLKVMTLAHLYNTVLYTNPESAVNYAREELQLSEKLDFKKGIGWANYHLGAYHQNAGNLDSARQYLRRSLNTHKSLGDHIRYASVLNSLAYLDQTEGRYDSAIVKYDEVLHLYQGNNNYEYAISLADKANVHTRKGHYRIALQQTLDALRVLDTVYEKPWRKADAQRQVGGIEFLRKNYLNSLEYLKKALVVYEQQEDNVYQAGVSNDIGNSFYQLGQLDSAQKYFKRSLKLSKVHGISETQANALSNIGTVYLDQGKFSEALTFLNDGLKIHVENNYKSNILETQNTLGKVYLRLNQPVKAIAYLNNTIESATDTGPINALKGAHLLRAEAYQKIGNIANALDDQKKFQILNDSIFNTTKSQQIEELRTIYEAEKKEQQIAFQEKEITVLEQQASISNLQKILLGASLLLALLLLYALRQKMKRNKLERQRVEAELAFKKKELTTHALHLAKKNEVLEGLKQKAKELKAVEGDKIGYQQLIRTIDFDLQDDNNWKNFAKYFEEVHKDFNGKVKRKYPQITSNELRLLALLKMNLTSKEIANILNISQEGIKKARYRLRKKLDISTEESLQDLVMTL